MKLNTPYYIHLPYVQKKKRLFTQYQMLLPTSVSKWTTSPKTEQKQYESI